MDISVIKEQLGNFDTFVDAINKLIENFPPALRNLGGLVTGEVKPFGDTPEYKESVASFQGDINAQYAEMKSK